MVKYLIKIYLLALLNIIVFSAVAQNTTIIKHTYYEISYDTVLKAPLMTYYIQTKEHALSKVNIDRKLVSSFLIDKKIPYKYHIANNSRYLKWNKNEKNDPLDKGHLAPYSAFDFDTLAAVESMYYTNTAPQHAYFNRHPWMRLEQYILRKLAVKYDTVYVWTGCLYGKNKMNSVPIPDYFWKIVKYDNKYECWIAKNDNSKNKDFQKYRISYEELNLFIKKYYPNLIKK